MISRSELNPHGYTLTPDQARNFELLYVAMNAVRCAYGKPMYVNSGVRSVEDQRRINPAHMQDAHVHAAGCDIDAQDGYLWDWCIDHLDLITRLGLYLESRVYTPRHIHFQIIPPKSGNRIFIP